MPHHAYGQARLSALVGLSPMRKQRTHGLGSSAAEHLQQSRWAAERAGREAAYASRKADEGKCHEAFAIAQTALEFGVRAHTHFESVGGGREAHDLAALKAARLAFDHVVRKCVRR